MPKKAKKPTSGRRGNPISLYPLTPEQAIRGIFQISKEDVKDVIAKSSKKRPKKG